MTSPYDDFAWLYDRCWSQPFQDWQWPAIDTLLLPGIPADGYVLDLCCGVGKLARALRQRGFHVTGVDSSAEMLRYAARNAPSAEFVHAPAARFSLSALVDAAVCTFDSVNHILSLAEVASAFACVRAVLRPGGHLVCDINTEAAYGERWDQTWCQVEADHAFFARGGYDRATQTGQTEITIFRQHDQWVRSDVKVEQRCYSVEEISAVLRGAGFAEVTAWRAAEDLGLEGHYGIGRVYLRACLSST